MNINPIDIELRSISKSFGGISALKDVTLQIRGGEIHALIGENGAGKSTLMKILSGAYQKDKGQIFIEDEKVFIRNPVDSHRYGIRIIYQEFSLIPDLSVAENIFISHFVGQNPWMNWSKIRNEAEKLIHDLGFDIDPTLKVKNLSIAQQHVVEIANALAFDVRVLILDEPSAVLGAHELRILFDTLRKLKNKGVEIVYISHHLEEIFELADKVTVLKSGQTVETKQVVDTHSEEIIRLMLGRPLDKFFPERTSVIGNPILTVTGLQLDNRIDNINLNVRSGEVVGIAGLVGSGRTEVLEGIFGARQRIKGEIKLDGKIINSYSTYKAVRTGLGLVPEDRKEKGLAISLSVLKNIALPNLRSLSNKFGFIKNRKESRIIASLLKNFDVKAAHPAIPVKNLSGGNQQKVVIAKWLNGERKVLLIDEPTRGVDVGAKIEIYNQINRLTEKGMGILLVSSEATELIGLCDRIIVMSDGEIVGELKKQEFSEGNILRLALNN